MDKVGEDFIDEIINNIESNVGFRISTRFRAATIINLEEEHSFFDRINKSIDINKFQEILEDIDWAYLMDLYASSRGFSKV